MKNILTLFFALALPAVAFAGPLGNASTAPAGSNNGSQAPALGTAVEGPEGAITNTNVGVSAENNLDRANIRGNVDLARNVQQTLASQGQLSQSLNSVRITAQGGRVTLQGSVNSNAERRDLINAVEKVPGVTSVEDQIQVNL